MKQALRREIFRLRKSLSDDDRKRRSNLIMQNLVEGGFLDGKRNVHLYYPINNEVCTIELIETLWKTGVNVIMPRTVVPGNTIANHIVSSFDQLEIGAFDLQEPKTVTPEYTGHCDIILAPGLVFDYQLNRMGYGGGFYDRFLSNTSALKVAPAYDFQLKESIPVEDHDVRMDHIVTEERIYNSR
ncbi:MAG: 5-formyltetrahydrofolate cyclo-ligase [Gammaproteobacteria bacterium]|nr:5-formyltetrahydrofolate cyclo-ligase [Gammaproteobacteria bacterium]